MSAINVNGAKERFCSILRATDRENIDYVIEDLESWGFFEAPASSQGHGAYPGGLLEHSLNVYDSAMATRRDLIAMRPDLAKELPEASVAISALLHDICKSNFYKLSRKKKRNEIGIFEDVEAYEIHDEIFPVGHGEKSVIMLLQSGLDLTDEEIYAIRWHMGAFDNAFRGGDRGLNAAYEKYPLAVMLHLADMRATYLVEREH